MEYRGGYNGLSSSSSSLCLYECVFVFFPLFSVYDNNSIKKTNRAHFYFVYTELILFSQDEQELTKEKEEMAKYFIGATCRSICYGVLVCCLQLDMLIYLISCCCMRVCARFCLRTYALHSFLCLTFSSTYRFLLAILIMLL